MDRKKLSWGIALSLGVMTLSIMTGMAILAWTPPLQAPPNGNINAPINTGAYAQTKEGQLNVDGGLGVGKSLFATDQGGSIELGNSLLSGTVPYIDFHFGKSAAQDYNVRMINNGDRKLTVDGNMYASSFCLGTKCCTDWDTCLEGGGVTPPVPDCTENEDCEAGLVCLSNGTCGKHPCSYSKPGAKRIFATSNAILGSQFDVSGKTKDQAADDFCRSMADVAKLPNSDKYKALVYLGARDPKTVLSPGQKLWNGVSSSDTSECTENIVSDTGAELFNTTGIKAPILGDEKGAALGKVFVWTNFRPAGPSSITYLSAGSMIWPQIMPSLLTPAKYCASQYGTAFNNDWYYSDYALGLKKAWNAGVVYGCSKTSVWYASGHWYGNNLQTNETWAYNVFAQPGAKENLNSSRVLYCVEQ